MPKNGTALLQFAKIPDPHGKDVLRGSIVLCEKANTLRRVR